jgi:hypothetical protein
MGQRILQRIAKLDPDRDYEEITRLSLEVLNGDPIFVHASYLVSFVRQVAVTSIARVIYRGGRGDNIRDVTRRTNDTVTFFSIFIHWGPSSPEGQAAIARMERIHARFPITAEQKRYTLATSIFAGDLFAADFGIDPYLECQHQALWRFWLAVGEQMRLDDLPPTRDEFWQWMQAYELEHWGYTTAGRRVVECFLADWERRWFPSFGRELGRQLLLASMGDRLRSVFRLPEPSLVAQGLVRAGARLYLPITRMRPLDGNRSWLDYFGPDGRVLPDLEQVGHQ